MSTLTPILMASATLSMARSALHLGLRRDDAARLRFGQVIVVAAASFVYGWLRLLHPDNEPLLVWAMVLAAAANVMAWRAANVTSAAAAAAVRR